MLQQLYIKNVALIDEALIEFEDGLNILSGETGAGKSIVIGSLAFVLGARANKDFIKKNSDKATVEVLLTLSSSIIKSEISDLGIEVNDDESILISRSYNKSGRNICKINGKPATLTMLKEIAEKFIDIHSQHEHQSLLNSSRHIILLDRFCEDLLESPKKELFSCLKNYKSILKNISDVSMGKGKDREELKDFFSYQINEIESANLLPNEDNTLAKKRKTMIQSEELKSFYISSSDLFYSYGDDMPNSGLGILQGLNSIIKNLEEIKNIDSSKNALYDDLLEVYVKIEDIAHEVKKQEDLIDYNENDLNQVEKRIDVIQKLKHKYGSKDNNNNSCIDDIIKFKDETSEKLYDLVHSEEKIAELYKQKELLEVKIKEICFNISEIRKNQAIVLEKNIETHLYDLGMPNAKFKIDIVQKSVFTQSGSDKVEFLICTNLGEDLKPLSKIASGGEMSRVMLSLKAVLSFVDTIDTFIFDEIDTGISGRTAQMVAEKMALLSKNNQIICITHLPQIVAMGDHQFLINKSSSDISTVTSIKKLSDEEAISELARMTGGVSITESTLLAAREMKQQALKIKNKNV
ncbi:MAG: DNA repair protein RecN [bacterium]